MNSPHTPRLPAFTHRASDSGRPTPIRHPRKSQPLSSRERGALMASLMGLVLTLIGRWLYGPIAQAQSFHDFANHHTHLGIANAWDVLSNLPFAMAGVVGLAALRRTTLSAPSCGAACVFFVGLLFTSAGSAIYHLAPNDAGLAVDRFGMAIAFAGLLGWIASEQIGPRAGHWALLGCSVFAPLSVLLWIGMQDLTAWAVLQFGGIAAILAMCTLPGPMRRAGFQLMAAYALAKLFETYDHEIFHALGEHVSGHSLKHLLASAAAIPPIFWLYQRKTLHIS